MTDSGHPRKFYKMSWIGRAPDHLLDAMAPNKALKMRMPSSSPSPQWNMNFIWSTERLLQKACTHWIKTRKCAGWSPSSTRTTVTSRLFKTSLVWAEVVDLWADAIQGHHLVKPQKSLEHLALALFKFEMEFLILKLAMVLMFWNFFNVRECLDLVEPQDMSTLIKSGTLWFSDFHMRWLTAMEALTCQGFPVHAEMSYMVPCCSFAARNAGLCNSDHPSRGATIGQSGNSMHTEVAGSVLTYALLEVKLDKFARQLVMGSFRSSPMRPLAEPTCKYPPSDPKDVTWNNTIWSSGFCAAEKLRPTDFTWLFHILHSFGGSGNLEGAVLQNLVAFVILSLKVST